MLITDDMTPQEFYNAGLSDRKSYEDRAETYAELTIPAVFRKEGTSGSDSLPDRYVQSLGAKLVKTLTANVGLAAFPPASTSFALSPNAEALQELTGAEPEKLAQVYRATSMGQDNINRRLDALSTRRMAFTATEQAVVVGSVVVEKKKKGYKTFNLRSFVVQLDDMGEADAICVYEEIRNLPKELVGTVPEKDNAKDTYKLYTMVERDYTTDDGWVLRQTIDNEYVGEPSTYKTATVPFKYLGWAWSQGEKYHRPFMEDNVGDMQSYDKLTKVLTKGSLVASKSLTFVDERGGRTRLRDVAKSGNGDVVHGRADDVTSFQHNKNFDFQVPQQVKQELGQALSSTFMVAQFRDAERVTAEEIQMRQQEIEKSLVAPYVTFNQGLIQTCVEWAIKDLALTFDEVDVDIIAGVDALGRSAEAQKLDVFMQRAEALQLRNWINDEELLNRYARYDSIDTVNLLKDAKTVADEQKQAQQAQTQQVTQEEMGKEVAKGAGAAMQQQPQQ